MRRACWGMALALTIPLHGIETLQPRDAYNDTPHAPEESRAIVLHLTINQDDAMALIACNVVPGDWKLRHRSEAYPLIYEVRSEDNQLLVRGEREDPRPYYSGDQANVPFILSLPYHPAAARVDFFLRRFVRFDGEKEIYKPQKIATFPLGGKVSPRHAKSTDKTR